MKTTVFAAALMSAAPLAAFGGAPAPEGDVGPGRGPQAVSPEHGGEGAAAPAGESGRAPMRRPPMPRYMPPAYGYRGPVGPQRAPVAGYGRAPAAAAPDAEAHAVPRETPAASTGAPAPAAGGADASRREMIEVLRRIEARLGRIETLLGKFTY